MTNKLNPPENICLLRLSAIGDISHMLPVINRLRNCWPDTQLTWIIGTFEHKLVCDVPGVDFITFNKRAGWRAYRDLRASLKGRQFDVLLHMQVSLRANFASAFINAKYRLGYDHIRSRDMHGCFINQHIAPQSNQHVADTFQLFLDTIGTPPSTMDWSVPVQDEDTQWAISQLGGKASFLISPCSSHPLRNWHAHYYAQIADYVIDRYHLQVVLCGGPGNFERDMAGAICQHAKNPLLNLVGKDTIKRMLALLQQAHALLSPDSGPAHMAACTNTPVIALHAASNPKRSGPYLSQEWCVDAYNAAALQYFHRPASKLQWGTKIEKPGVMNLVTIEAVRNRIDALAQAQQWSTAY